MKLQWFEIENFRSIISKTRCNVEHDITVIAGKNESGKSNILHALRAFATGKFEDTDVPEGLEVEPKVTVSYTIERSELDLLARKTLEFTEDDRFEVVLSKNVYEVTFQRVAGGKIIVSGEALDTLKDIQDGELNYWKLQVDELLNDIKKAEVLMQNKEQMKEMNKEGIPEWVKFLSEMLVNLTNTPSAEEIAEYKDRLESYEGYVNFYAGECGFSQGLWDSAPKFVLFDSFEDILPSEASADDIKRKDILQRFFTLAGIDPADIFNEESSKKRTAIVNSVSSLISGDFCGYYKQSEVVLKLNVDGPKVQFYVFDGQSDTPFYPEQRSKGFQWFLSFYLMLKSTGIDESHIILIDEPGLYLHANAQREMLQILENLSGRHQILFSTHSPYLIDTEHLYRVRLVIKDGDAGCTRVENKIQKVADKDVLKPIITAIGHDLGRGLGLGRNFNIITEGLSDYYYVHAFVRLLAPELLDEIGVIPAVGADQVPNIASIMLGWGVKCVALFDNDQQGRANHSKLVKKLGFVDGIDTLFVSDTKGNAIEDLFAQADFYELVLGEPVPNTPSKNSSVAGERKVILAKQFHRNVMSNLIESLSEESRRNIQNLLENLGVRVTAGATA